MRVVRNRIKYYKILYKIIVLFIFNLPCLDQIFRYAELPTKLFIPYH